MTSLTVCNERITKIEARRDYLIERKKEIETKLLNIEKETLLNEKASEVLKKAIDYFYSRSIKKLEDLVSFGLKEVFFDKDITVKTELIERRGHMNLDLITVDNEEGVSGRARDSFGGAVVQVQAILVLIVVNILLNQRRFIIMDEKFSNVSAQYQPYVGKLLSRLAKEFNFDMLLVTHNHEILEHADKVYHGRLQNGELKIRQKIHEKPAQEDH